MNVPAPEPHGKVLPNPAFFAWLKGNPIAWISQSIAAVLGFVTFTYYITGLGSHVDLTARQLVWINTLIHIPLLLVACIYFAFHLDDHQEGRTRTGFLWKSLFFGAKDSREEDIWKDWKVKTESAEKAVRYFKLYFLGFITCTLMYYAWSFRNSQNPWDDKEPKETRGTAIVIDSIWVGGNSTRLPLQVQRIVRKDSIWDAEDTTRQAERVQLQRDLRVDSIRVAWVSIDAKESPNHNSCFRPDPRPPDENTNPCADCKVRVFNGHCPNESITSDPVSIFSLMKIIEDEYVGFVLNTIEGVFLLLCFLQLWRPNEGLGRWGKMQWSTRWKYVLAGVAALVAFVAPLFVGCSIAGKPTFGDLVSITIVLNWVSGLFVAVVMMLLISRLDSKLIGLQSNLVGVLYAYAAVQTLFAVFPPGEMVEIKAFTLYAVLFLKLYFFFIIQYALVQGRIFCYLVCAPEIQLRRGTPIAGRMQKSRTFFGAMALIVITALYGLLSHKEIGSGKGPEAINVALHELEKPLDWLNLAVCLSGLMMGAIWLLSGRKSVVRGNRKREVGNLMRWWSCYYTVRAKRRWNRLTLRWPSWESMNELSLTDQKLKSKEQVWVDNQHLDSAIARFVTRFVAFLGCLVLFYAWELWGKGLLTGTTRQADALRTMVLVLLNGASGLFLFQSFLELAKPRTCLRYKKKRLLYRRFSWMLFGALVLMGAMVFYRWSSASDLSTPDEGRLLLWNTVSGVLVSIVLALFIARFDGTLMWQNTAEIRWLMIYAGMQPLMVLFGSVNEAIFEQIKIITIAQACLLKLWLILVVARAVHGGALTGYLLMFPDFDERANRVFRNSFLIRNGSSHPGQFTIDIYENDVRVLSSSNVLAGGQQGFMKTIRRLCTEQPTYVQDEVNGAYAVRAKFEGLTFTGHRDFPSEEKAQEFITKFKNRLPFAKVTYE